MADADHVQVTLRVGNDGIARQGFGTALILSHNATWPEFTRSYGSHADVLEDWDADSPEALAAGAMFAQSPAPSVVKIGRADGDVTQRYEIHVSSVDVGRKYEIEVSGQGFDGDTVSYTPEADFTFVDGDVNAGTEEITEVDHGMTTGDGPYRLSNVGGALPVGLAADTNYWIIVIDEDTFQLANSKANALALTPVLITSAAGAGTHTLRRAQNDVIIAQLVQGLNAITDKNYSATQQAGAGETDYMLVTASAVNDWFSIAVKDPTALSSAQTHGDADVDEDLAAILDADADWYMLHTLYNSQDYVLTAAAWVEANKRKYFVDVVETESITTSYTPTVSTDTIAKLADLGYTRVTASYYPTPATMFSAAWEGRLLPLNPGAWTAKFKTLSGVAPVVLTATQRSNLTDRRGNSYELSMGRAITFEGTVGSTVYGFSDVVVGLDALVDDVRKGVFGVQVSLDKVSYEDPDIATIQAALLASAAKYSSEERPVLRRDPKPVVTVPLAASIPAGTRATRVLTDCKIKGELAGAVHKVQVEVVVGF